MSGYGDETTAVRLLALETKSRKGAAEQAELAGINQALSDDLDAHLGRHVAPQGTVNSPVIWTEDAPLGWTLPLDDFSALVQVLAYGVDITAACVPVTVQRRWRPAYQALIYAPAGVPTGWVGNHATSLGALTIKVVAGYPAVPTPLVQAATEALCRAWRGRGNMYTDGGGMSSTGMVPTPTPRLDADYQRAVAGWVRTIPVAVKGP